MQTQPCLLVSPWGVAGREPWVGEASAVVGQQRGRESRGCLWGAAAEWGQGWGETATAGSWRRVRLGIGASLQRCGWGRALPF